MERTAEERETLRLNGPVGRWRGSGVSANVSDSPSLRLRLILQGMSDLTDDDKAIVAKLLRDTIAAARNSLVRPVLLILAVSTAVPAYSRPRTQLMQSIKMSEG